MLFSAILNKFNINTREHVQLQHNLHISSTSGLPNDASLFIIIIIIIRQSFNIIWFCTAAESLTRAPKKVRWWTLQSLRKFQKLPIHIGSISSLSSPHIITGAAATSFHFFFFTIVNFILVGHVQNHGYLFRIFQSLLLDKCCNLGPYSLTQGSYYF